MPQRLICVTSCLGQKKINPLIGWLSVIGEGRSTRKAALNLACNISFSLHNGPFVAVKSDSLNSNKLRRGGESLKFLIV